MSVTVSHVELAVKVLHTHTHKRNPLDLVDVYGGVYKICFLSFYLSSIPPFVLSVSCQCRPHRWFRLVSLGHRERQRGRDMHTVLRCLHINRFAWQYYQPQSFQFHDAIPLKTYKTSEFTSSTTR